MDLFDKFQASKKQSVEFYTKIVEQKAIENANLKLSNNGVSKEKITDDEFNTIVAEEIDKIKNTHGGMAKAGLILLGLDFLF